MKWFKHISDSGDDPDIDDSFSLFKSDGPYVFWRTLEVMSREFDISNPGINTFTIDFFSGKFRLRWDRVLLVLQFFNQRERIKIDLSNGDEFDYITLNCPKLKKLCDDWTKKQLPKGSEVSP